MINSTTTSIKIIFLFQAEIDEVEDESEINDHISSLPHHDFFHHQQQETTSTSGYSSSSIESYQLFAAEHATTNSSSSSASMKSRHSPVIEEVEEEEEESIAAEEKLKALSSKYEETADRCRRLESVVARVKMENAALKSEPDSDDLDSIMYQSVQEEVSNVDVVRAGKLCRRCMGPMEEYSPAALIGQAATQVGTVLRKEVSLCTYKFHHSGCIKNTFSSLIYCWLYVHPVFSAQGPILYSIVKVK